MTIGKNAYLRELQAELEGSPYWRHMGIRFAGISEEEAQLEIPVCWTLLIPNGGVRGGTVASLPDAAIDASGLGAYAVSCEPGIGEATGEAAGDPL